MVRYIVNRRKFLNQWIPPVVAAVSLPAHAQTTTTNLPRPLVYRASIINQVCDDQVNPPTASFTFCNEEAGSITIEQAIISRIDVPNSTSPVTQLTPALPVSIPANTCIDFQIVGASGSAYRCGDSLILGGTHINPLLIGYITFPI